MPYIGKADCQNCDREVDVSTNVNGMAYYRCGPCGFKAQHTTQRGNAKFLETVRRDVDADDAGDKPADPVKEQKPDDTPVKAKPRMRAGFFGG